ncbi:hypothetical protein EZ428_23845 [Pedobacter frigiditerrae]|uniref:DUF4407 domain-containing protein n=1 Tax=Pedobacter frigiditerrae TaxID=2530452 RepID=A0A4R0MIS2_9SPHI|nr:hypothetical protein [Pedobacter frigiditerrae]TCC86499.1 hypothetical protein EZ428_23845 [Pedobacter frigiditerrae]
MYKKSITAADLFLAILAVLLISVSFYQTWLGLQQIFGGSSFVIALVLSLILLFLLWQIRIAKTIGNATASLGWIYFFFASFCFIANFNALYTRFMKTDIYKTELREINEQYNFLEADIKKKLNYSITDEKARQAIVSKTQQLTKQITDKGTPGFGNKALQLTGEIEKMLGQKLTLLTVYRGDYEDLSRRMEVQIIDMMDQLSPAEKTLKNDVEDAKLHWNRQIEKLLQMSKEQIDDLAQGEIDKSLQQYNDLVNRAKSVLGEEKIKTELVHSKTQEVGKIGYAFDHAIKNFGMFQFVVLAGCVLLDFGIMFIILLIPADERDKIGKGSILNTRKGKTLITK